MFPFLSFAKLFCFACILESMEWGWGGAFSCRRASIVQKAAQTERWIRFLAKGGAGHMWREIGVFLGKKAECFLNELQNQVSCRHQCLWGGQDCVSCPLLQWVPRILQFGTITVQGKLCIALVWQAFFLSYPFYYCALLCVKFTLSKAILKWSLT